MTEREWASAVREKLAAKMPYAVRRADEADFIPYTTEGTRWKGFPESGIWWWTNGFWSAEMWQMYRMTGEEIYKAEARRAEAMLDAAFEDEEELHHDVGFMWHISSGVDYRLTGDAASRKRALKAARVLASRFNPLGFIRAWNGDRVGWSIVDTLMNLPLLYWASEETGDPRFRKMAMAHADMALEHFLRPDGSCNHIVKFDPETMEVLEIPGGQGIAAGSSWSRGQSWALYGFALSYRHTGKREYLEAAKRVAHYFIACVSDDWIPDCDFRAPKLPVLKDDVAGGVAACGLLEIESHVDEREKRLYHSAAVNILRAMERCDADWTEESPAILRRCTGSYHDEASHHIYMNSGDYFFIEAVGRLLGEETVFW